MSDNIVGNIVHFSPGRVRLRLSRAYRTPENLAQIEGLVSGMDGVRSVESNLASGSVLIRYDPQVLDPSNLLALGAEIGLVSDNGVVERESWSEVGTRLRGEAAKRMAGVALVVGAAALGGVLGPSLGLSSRAASLSATFAVLLVEKVARRSRSTRRDDGETTLYD